MKYIMKSVTSISNLQSNKFLYQNTPVLCCIIRYPSWIAFYVGLEQVTLHSATPSSYIASHLLVLDGTNMFNLKTFHFLKNPKMMYKSGSFGLSTMTVPDQEQYTVVHT